MPRLWWKRHQIHLGTPWLNCIGRPTRTHSSAAMDDGTSTWVSGFAPNRAPQTVRPARSARIQEPIKQGAAPSAGLSLAGKWNPWCRCNHELTFDEGLPPLWGKHSELETP